MIAANMPIPSAMISHIMREIFSLSSACCGMTRALAVRNLFVGIVYSVR